MRSKIKFSIAVFTITALVALQKPFSASGQANSNAPELVAGIPVNYDEALVGGYVLPDTLLLANGKKVKDAKTWHRLRRPEIVKLVEENIYGRAPEPPKHLRFNVFDKGTPALDGKAIRKQVTVYFSEDDNGPKMDLLIYLPAGATQPVPLLLNINFFPNASITDDTGVKPGTIWDRNRQRVPAPPYSGRGKLVVEPFLAKGIGVATVYYGGIEPDFDGGIKHGVRSLYLKPGQEQFAPDEWGAIGAWAWG